MGLRHRMLPLPIKDVEINDRFWTRRQRSLIENGLEAQYQQILSTGRLENFHRVARKEFGTHVGKVFDDSDVYKWLEACAYALAIDPNTIIKQRIDDFVAAIENAQEPDGYIDTFIQLNHPNLRWRNLGSMHEMYCAGHLIEAAVALDQCSGDRKLLDVAIKFADHIADTFGPGRKKGYCGHEEIELALIKLSDHTRDRNYRELAKWMVMQRGSRPSPFEAELEDKEAMELSKWVRDFLCRDGKYVGEYLQDHAPVVQHTDVVGHAVRAMYLYIAAAELACEDPQIGEALQRAWTNLTEKRMYITGGIGPSGDNEGFTFDYDLPNRSAYAETCAAVGLVLWGRQMLEQTGVSDYSDTIERALFNGALSGISLDGTKYFYTNPLESRGEHKRVPWFGCACCPPNIARLILSASNQMVSVSAEEEPPAIWLHIPTPMEAKFSVGGSNGVMRVQGDYPWSGDFTVSFELDQPTELELRVRIPAWCNDCKVIQADGSAPSEFESGYAVLRQLWKPGDRVEMQMQMPPVWMQASSKVIDNVDRVSLCRGPLVYCLEEIDAGCHPTYFRVLPVEEPLVEFEEVLLEGVSTLQVPIAVLENQADFEELYSSVEPERAVRIRSSSIAKFIPYYAWNNRGPSAMQVWISRLS